MAFRVSGLVSFWLFRFWLALDRSRPTKGSERSEKNPAATLSRKPPWLAFLRAVLRRARSARAGAPRLRARPRRRVPRTLGAPRVTRQRRGRAAPPETYRVDVDVAAPLGVLVERDAVLGHARVHLEAGARLDVARGGLGDQAGRHGGAEGYGGHLGSGGVLGTHAVLWRGRRVARSQKRFFVEKLHKWQRSKKIPPDRGCRRSIERAGRAAISPFALIDSVSKKIVKIKSSSETLLIGPGNQD